MKSGIHTLTLLIVLSVALLSSCRKDLEKIHPKTGNGFETIKVPDEFLWVTSKNLKIDLVFTDALNKPLFTEFQVYDKYPEGTLLFQGTSNDQGAFTKKYRISSSCDKLVVVAAGNDPVTVAFADTLINGYDALLARKTIQLTARTQKSTRAVDMSYYPAQGRYGTLCFEDFWPSGGDYDFNDAVIDYNVVSYGETSNPGYINRVEMTLFLRAKGASLRNGFGISFRQHWSFNGPYPEVASVTVNGENIPQENTTYPSFLLIPDLSAELPPFNTLLSENFTNPVRFDVVIVFAQPIDEWEIELPLQNPFMIVGQNRGREIHRPYDLPTSLADVSYAGSADDNTDPEAFNPDNFKMMMGYTTYVTEAYFPWVLDIYDATSTEFFYYPIENEDLSEAYPSFEGWILYNDPDDWYKPSYGVSGLIYPHQP